MVKLPPSLPGMSPRLPDVESHSTRELGASRGHGSHWIMSVQMVSISNMETCA